MNAPKTASNQNPEPPSSHPVLGPLLSPLLKFIRKAVLAYYEKDAAKRFAALEERYQTLERAFHALAGRLDALSLPQKQGPGLEEPRVVALVTRFDAAAHDIESGLRHLAALEEKCAALEILRPAMEAAHAALRAEHDALLQRYNLLEEVITEHPMNAARGYRDDAFPSPAVTVIMPVWNRAALVQDAIRSVQAQTFRDWELLVVDDGSSDGTEDAVKIVLGDSRIRYVKQEHKGQCHARNHGLKHAKGALIAYLDSDNVWYPEFLSAAAAAMAADPQRQSLYGAMVTQAHKPGRRILFETFDREKLLESNFIGISTYVHRRSLYENLGGFDEGLTSVEDWDLILRYTKNSPAYPLPVRAVRYRALDARVTDRATMDDMRRVYGKWGK